jgi:hypothetical protein
VISLLHIVDITLVFVYLYFIADSKVLDGFHRFFCKPFDHENQMWEFTYPIQDDDQSSKDIYRKLDNKEDPKSDSLAMVISFD